MDDRPDTIYVFGMPEAMLRKVYDAVKTSGVDVVCSMEQWKKIQQWRAEEKAEV